MNKFLRVGAALAVSAAALIAASTQQAAGVDVPIADVGVAVTSDPGTVSPAGADVIYTVTITNSNAVPATVDLTDTTSGGTIVSAPSSCTGGLTLTCNGVSVPAFGALNLRVVVQTPTNAPSITNTATVKVPAGLALDLNADNDTATATTQITGATTGSYAFVPQDGTLQWRKHLLTVRQAKIGVLASLSDTDFSTPMYCGSTSTPCRSGLHADFTKGGDTDDFYGLMSIDVNFGQTDPCHGIGADKCHPLYVYKPSPLETSRTAIRIPACESTGTIRPCLESTYKSTRNEFHFVVVLDSNDPDLATTSSSLLK